MDKNLDTTREYLSQVVEDKAILDELVAINMLPFVDTTYHSCSGHCDRYGLANADDPYFTLRYESVSREAQEFHKSLMEIGADVEGTRYRLVPINGDRGGLIYYYFPYDIHAQPVVIPSHIVANEIPPGNQTAGYHFFIPRTFNLENPANRNVSILESFLNEMS